MKRTITAFILVITMIIGLVPEMAPAAAAGTTNQIRVTPSDENGIPAQIDLFQVQTGDSSEGACTYQLYLPGNADPEKCFLSWDNGMSATVDGTAYESGACPVPPVNTQKTYTFDDGSSLNVITYQGSEQVPSVFIDIDENMGTIADMDGDTKHDASCSGNIYIDGTRYELSKIKGRGNWTWSSSDDKRPYNISLGEKINFPGVDSAKTKKWSLLCDVGDHSLMRNRAGYSLAHEIGVGQDTNSADVWMNGEYQGCYTVTPKNDSFVDKNGYMIEIDNYKEDPVADGGDPQFALDGMVGIDMECLITVKKIGDNLLKKDGIVDESPENLEAVAGNIQDWMQDAWDAIRSDDGYNAKGKYYTDYIDIESFAKMYLMQEYVKSNDVCSGSLLFHREGTADEDKLIAGPLWDLDNSLGFVHQNELLGDLRSAKGYYIANVDDTPRTSLYKTLGKHEDFMKEVELQYVQHHESFMGLSDKVDQMSGDIKASALMNHIKVRDLPGCNLHKYNADTVIDKGTAYEQHLLATPDSATDWENYAANLKSYIAARSLWFRDAYIHKLRKIKAVPATCTKAGNIEYWSCEYCGRLFRDENAGTEIKAKDVIISKQNHSYRAWTTTKQATEIATGSQSRTCSKCGKKEVRTIPALSPTLPGVKILKPKSKKRAVLVKWKKLSKAKRRKVGYLQIQYSQDKSFKKSVKTVTAKKNASSKKIRKLKSKKTYYVRIRSYKRSGHAVHISKWSKVKAVKIK